MAEKQNIMDDQLCGAVREGDVETVLRCVDEGADLNSQTRQGMPLSLAAYHCKAELVKVLLSTGADPNNKDDHGFSALHISSKKGDLKAMKHCIDGKAEVNLEDGEGNTPLILAAKYGQSDAAALLIKSGADVNHRNGEGKTALMCLCDDSYMFYLNVDKFDRTLSVLIDAKAGLNMQDNSGCSCLHLCAQHGNADDMGSLLEAGSNPNLQDNEGQSALHHSALSGHGNCITVLLDAGADVNAQDVTGKTSLHYCTLNRDKEGAICLLQAGADPGIRDNDNMTAEQLAKANFKHDMAHILKSYKPSKPLTFFSSIKMTFTKAIKPNPSASRRNTRSISTSSLDTQEVTTNIGTVKDRRDAHVEPPAAVVEETSSAVAQSGLPSPSTLAAEAAAAAAAFKNLGTLKDDIAQAVEDWQDKHLVKNANREITTDVNSKKNITVNINITNIIQGHTVQLGASNVVHTSRSQQLMTSSPEGDGVTHKDGDVYTGHVTSSREVTPAQEAAGNGASVEITRAKNVQIGGQCIHKEYLLTKSCDSDTDENTDDENDEKWV